MKRLLNNGIDYISNIPAYGKQLLVYRRRRQRERARSIKHEREDARREEEHARWEMRHFDLMEEKRSVGEAPDEDLPEPDVDCRDLFCGDHGDRERYQLKWEELFCFAICVRFSFAYVIAQLEMLNNFGPALTLSLSSLLIVCACIPVLTTFIFLGNFTKRYFIKMWDCVPVLKGLPFAIALYAIPIQVYNTNFSAVAFIYFWVLLHNLEIPWVKCDFKGASENCIPMTGAKQIITTECCDEIRDPNCSFMKIVHIAPKYATLDFWMTIRNVNYNLEGKANSGSLKFVTGKIFSLMVVYLIVFMFVVVGMKRYRVILGRIVIFAAIGMVPIIGATILYGANIPSPQDKYSVLDRFFMYDFWSAVAGHSISMELPTEMVNFGAQSPITTTPTAAAIIVYVTIEIIILLLTVWMCISYQQAQQNYKIKDYRCLLLRGQVFLFVLIPDMLSRWYLGYQILLVYFLFLFIWGITAVIIKCTACVDALTGQFPKLRAYRTAVTGALCTLMFAYNIFLISGGFFEFNYERVSTQTPVIRYVLTFTVALGLFIYTPERIAVDYQFTHGVRLSNYFIYGVKLYIGIALTMVVLLNSLIHELHNINYFVHTLVLAPIPIGALFIIFQYLLGYREAIVESHPQWGPKNVNVRLERNWFDPTHHFILDTSQLVCKHSCLRNSSKLDQEVLVWKLRRNAHEAGKEVKQRVAID